MYQAHVDECISITVFKHFLASLLTAGRRREANSGVAGMAFKHFLASLLTAGS
jgi:hypothetical protein